VGVPYQVYDLRQQKAGATVVVTLKGNGANVRLSSLIDVLNDKFGMNLSEAAQVWFDQQVEAAVQNDDLREVASANTEENFAFEFDRQFADVMEKRHSLNDDLFRMFFDKPEFQEALTTWARREVYRRIQDDLGGAA
jgi:type I restriction enzyme R subunit